jgi:hypothetical protein
MLSVAFVELKRISQLDLLPCHKASVQQHS